MSIKKKQKRLLSYEQAISEAHCDSMKKDPNVFLIGLGVTDYKGIFGTTKKAYDMFGPKRVIETPASENALTGMCIGASLKGKKPVIIHARNDFMFLSIDQMMNIASKWKYTYAGKSKVPFVVRGIIGKGWGQGPTHSQSIQSVFMHFPGMYVFMPATAYDAKAAIVTALKQDCPCLIFEHRRLYDSIGHVPKKTEYMDIGKANVIRKGKDITIVAISIMVKEAIKASVCLEKMEISAEVVDPRMLVPLDEKTIIKSVKKTGKVIVTDTSWKRCGASAEIAAVISEKAHKYLKKPLKRICQLECPSPVSKVLEDAFYPTYKDIVIEACNLMGKKVNKKYVCDNEIDNFVGPY